MVAAIRIVFINAATCHLHQLPISFFIVRTDKKVPIKRKIEGRKLPPSATIYMIIAATDNRKHKIPVIKTLSYSLSAIHTTIIYMLNSITIEFNT
jgi:hypothetical protein